MSFIGQLRETEKREKKKNWTKSQVYFDQANGG